MYQVYRTHRLEPIYATQYILTSVDSDEPVQSPFKLTTPNDVQSVA